MSGHNKWSTIKHKKGKADAARAKVFTQISKEIFVAVRQSGPDPTANFRLRLCIQKAKAANMPMDNVNRAIQKAAGNQEGVAYEEIVYEGYGAGGIAIMCELLTDNRNRVASDIRYIFSRNNGNLGETGCVSYMFERKGRLTIEDEEGTVDVDELMLLALDAGAEDVLVDNPEQVEIIYPIETAEITMIPANTIEITDEEAAAKVLTLLDKLEDYDDIQNVYHNADIPEELMEKLDI